MSEGTEQPSAGGTFSRSGLTLVVLKDDRIADIVSAGRELLETQFRQNLELAKQGVLPELREGDGCCNCVAC